MKQYTPQHTKRIRRSLHWLNNRPAQIDIGTATGRVGGLARYVIAVAVVIVAQPAFADSDALTRYVVEQTAHLDDRAMKDAPRLSRDEIRQALDGDLIIKKANLPGSADLRYVFVARALNADAADLWRTVLDREHYPLFNENITEAFIVQMGEDRFQLYNVLEAPLVSTRHQVLDCMVNTKIFQTSNGVIWEHYWSLVPDVTTQIPQVLAGGKFTRITPDDVDGAVIVQRNDGSWLQFPLPDGRTWIETFLVNHPGGRIPEWIVNKVAGRAAENTTESYQDWAASEARRHADAAHAPILSPDGRFVPPATIAVGVTPNSAKPGSAETQNTNQ